MSERGMSDSFHNINNSMRSYSGRHYASARRTSSNGGGGGGGGGILSTGSMHDRSGRQQQMDRSERSISFSPYVVVMDHHEPPDRNINSINTVIINDNNDDNNNNNNNNNNNEPHYILEGDHEDDSSSYDDVQEFYYDDPSEEDVFANAQGPFIELRSIGGESQSTLSSGPDGFSKQQRILAAVGIVGGNQHAYFERPSTGGGEIESNSSMSRSGSEASLEFFDAVGFVQPP